MFYVDERKTQIYRVEPLFTIVVGVVQNPEIHILSIRSKESSSDCLE
jgi:hypothetical protein